MKKTKKLLIVLILIILIIQVFSCLTNSSFASATISTDDTVESTENSDTESGNALEDLIGGAIDGIAGVLLIVPRWLITILGGVLGIIMGFFAQDGSLMGTVKSGGLTLEDILFNRVQLLDVNFFDFSGSTKSTSYMIRENVAIWFTSIRNIAIIVLAIIAVYVGIRMALSTIAEDKAKYKTMLIDWLTSLALVFVLQYIMIFTIGINNAFINVLSKGLTDNSNGQYSNYSDQSNVFLQQALFNPSFTTGFGSAIIYLLLQGITFVFLLSYIRRMITIAFLIVISPLVTITYSIDKMGDGRSQALNVWLKEFIYNILIQPFHCVSYLILGTTAIKLMTENTGWTGGVGLTKAVIAIALLIFIYTAEKIVKHIFHFETQSMADTVAQAAVVGTLVSTVTNGAKKAGAGGGAIKNFANGNSQNSQNQSNSLPPTQSNTATVTIPPTETTQQQPIQTTPIPPTAQNNNQSANNRPKKNQFIGRVLNGVSEVSPRLFGAAVAGTLGLATGNPTAMFTSGVAGYGLGAQYAQKRDLKLRQREMAQAVNRYKNAGNQNMTLDDLTNNALEFADGTKIAQTDEEIQLRDAMQRLQIQYARQGLDEKKIIKQAKQTVKDINNGFISELSAGDRFVGSIKQKFENFQENQRRASQRRTQDEENI